MSSVQCPKHQFWMAGRVGFQDLKFLACWYAMVCYGMWYGHWGGVLASTADRVPLYMLIWATEPPIHDTSPCYIRVYPISPPIHQVGSYSNRGPVTSPTVFV